MRFLILALFMLTGCSRTSNPYWHYMSNTQDAYYLRYYAEQVICPTCADTCHTAVDYDECVRRNLARMMLRLEVKHDRSDRVKTRGQMVDKKNNDGF